MVGQPSELPLAVDLDGTLILTDMSWVSIRRVLLPRPWRILRFIWLEITGQRALWKQRLGKLLKFDPAELEFHPSFMEWVTGEYARGRELYLVTASDRLIAEAIAAHLVAIFKRHRGTSCEQRTEARERDAVRRFASRRARGGAQ